MARMARTMTRMARMARTMTLMAVIARLVVNMYSHFVCCDLKITQQKKKSEFTSQLHFFFNVYHDFKPGYVFCPIMLFQFLTAFRSILLLLSGVFLHHLPSLNTFCFYFCTCKLHRFLDSKVLKKMLNILCFLEKS